MMEWQTITTALIVIGACLYVLRRVWQRLNSFRMAKRDGEAAACGQSCSCDNGKPQASPDFTAVRGRQ